MDPAPHLHPNAPRRGPVYTVFALVVASGILGALIGSGLARASCDEEPSVLERLLSRLDGFESAARSCTSTQILTTLGGAVIASVGAGVVGILVLRAMSDWSTHPPAPESPEPPPEG
jgi:hypothetical protein